MLLLHKATGKLGQWTRCWERRLGATTCQRTTDRRATLPGPAVSNKGVSLSVCGGGLASENHRGAE